MDKITCSETGPQESASETASVFGSQLKLSHMGEDFLIHQL